MTPLEEINEILCEISQRCYCTTFLDGILRDVKALLFTAKVASLLKPDICFPYGCDRIRLSELLRLRKLILGLQLRGDWIEETNDGPEGMFIRVIR